MCFLWQALESHSLNPSPSTQAFGLKCWSTALCSSSTCWKKTVVSTCVESAMTSGPTWASRCTSTSKVSLTGRQHLLEPKNVNLACLVFVLLTLLFRAPAAGALKQKVKAKAQRLSELNFDSQSGHQKDVTTVACAVLSAWTNPTKATHTASTPHLLEKVQHLSAVWPRI